MAGAKLVLVCRRFGCWLAGFGFWGGLVGVGPVVGGFGGVWGLGERPVGGFVVQSERGEAGDVVGCG